jgi:hypothetical protein
MLSILLNPLLDLVAMRTIVLGHHGGHVAQSDRSNPFLPTTPLPFRG